MRWEDDLKKSLVLIGVAPPEIEKWKSYKKAYIHRIETSKWKKKKKKVWMVSSFHPWVLKVRYLLNY